MAADHASRVNDPRVIAAEALIAGLERNIAMSRAELDAALAGVDAPHQGNGAISARQWARELATLRLALDEAQQALERALQALPRDDTA